MLAKAFLGIVCILLTLGPIMMIDSSESGLLLKFIGSGRKFYLGGAKY